MMFKDVIEDLREFLNDANLSTYEINAFITLLRASKARPPTAKRISSNSNVPSGRIYEILEELKTKGLLEIIDSRPKKYIALSLNKALENLLDYQSNENKRKIGYLYDKAKLLESHLYESDVLLRKEPSKLFWSTTYGTKEIISMYVKYIERTKEEILFNEFINKSTLKIIPFGRLIYEAKRNAIYRGVRIRNLWSFDYDHRPLSEEEKEKKYEIYMQIKSLLYKHFDLSTELSGFDMKYIFHRTTTYFDIFDKKRIIFKLLNPIKPYQIFACMNVVDPKLAEELRSKFLNMWRFEAIQVD